MHAISAMLYSFTIAIVSEVDTVLLINWAGLQTQICNRFGIKKYPTMKYGHASDFDEGSEQGLAEISGKLTAEEVIKWLSKRLNTYVIEHAP